MYCFSVIEKCNFISCKDSKKNPKRIVSDFIRVKDGSRTHDLLNHNQAL